MTLSSRDCRDVMIPALYSGPELDFQLFGVIKSGIITLTITPTTHKYAIILALVPKGGVFSPISLSNYVWTWFKNT